MHMRTQTSATAMKAATMALWKAKLPLSLLPSSDDIRKYGINRKASTKQPSIYEEYII
jgi:hypothetical protein